MENVIEEKKRLCRGRPMGQWLASLLPKPRPRVQIPGEAWIFPCAVQSGVEIARPPGTLHKLAIIVGDTQGQELIAHVPHRWI